MIGKRSNDLCTSGGMVMLALIWYLMIGYTVQRFCLNLSAVNVSAGSINTVLNPTATASGDRDQRNCT